MYIQKGYLEDYQSRQLNDQFKGAELLIVLLGEQGPRSRFIGVFRVLSTSRDIPALPERHPYPEMGQGKVYYALEEVTGFEDLKDRLVISWGTYMKSWVEWLNPEKPKEVIEILPKGHVHDFPGYHLVLLKFVELEGIIRHPDANKVWHKALSAVAGVYLITDTTDGAQYVGSAYGKDGLLGRWATYVRTKHGGNVQLRALLKDTPNRNEDFQYSILQTLPKTLTDREVFSVEKSWKEKLGTRAFGLNRN